MVQNYNFLYISGENYNLLQLFFAKSKRICNSGKKCTICFTFAFFRGLALYFRLCYCEEVVRNNHNFCKAKEQY